MLIRLSYIISSPLIIFLCCINNSECASNVEGYYCKIEEQFCFNTSHVACLRKNESTNISDKNVSKQIKIVM